MSPIALPIGVNLTSIGVTAGWWLDSARRLEKAGFSAVWSWDHFISRGRRTDPVLECWTTLAATAAVTHRIRVGSLVTNVMNRHPSVLARMAATVADLSDGRLDVGIGIGGHPAEHEALGIPFPEVPERIARLEETVQVLRALWSGGPVDFTGPTVRLTEAHAFPIALGPPRIIVGGQTPGGARLAARTGDGWNVPAEHFAALLPVYLEALGTAERQRSEMTILVSLQSPGGWPAEEGALEDLAAEAERWAQSGADELVLDWVRPRELSAVLDAAERAALS